MTVLCAVCYDFARKQNGVWPFVDKPAQVLRSCAENFGAAPRTISWWQRATYFRSRRPEWAAADDIQAHFRQYRQMLERGRVTWGCTVQANHRLFEEGPQDGPGEVVYVRDPARPVDLVELHRVARQLYSIKGTQQPDPLFEQLSSYLTNEKVRVFGLPVPALISPRVPCAISTTYFNRRHLPNGILSVRTYPILVAREEPWTVTVLPSRYWPEELRAHWCSRAPARKFQKR